MCSRPQHAHSTYSQRICQRYSLNSRSMLLTLHCHPFFFFSGNAFASPPWERRNRQSSPANNRDSHIEDPHHDSVGRNNHNAAVVRNVEQRNDRAFPNGNSENGRNHRNDVDMPSLEVPSVDERRSGIRNLLDSGNPRAGNSLSSIHASHRPQTPQMASARNNSDNGNLSSSTSSSSSSVSTPLNHGNADGSRVSPPPVTPASATIVAAATTTRVTNSPRAMIRTQASCGNARFVRHALLNNLLLAVVVVVLVIQLSFSILVGIAWKRCQCMVSPHDGPRAS